jgi:phage shock protein PspC (stress-responsive transcriptional regulator)
MLQTISAWLGHAWQVASYYVNIFLTALLLPVIVWCLGFVLYKVARWTIEKDNKRNNRNKWQQ